MSRWFSDERSFARAVDGVAVAVLAGLTVIAARTFRDYGLGWDDYTHAEYGELLLGLLSSGFADQRAFHFVNLYMYGGGFDMLAALVAKILPFDLFETRRLVGALVGIVGLVLTWRVGRKLGGPLGGLLAVLLLAISPLYYGHMFINPKDSPFAVAMIVLLLGLLNALSEYPRPSPATLAITGIGIGLAVGTRIIGLIFAPCLLAVLGLIYAAELPALGYRSASCRVGRFVVMLVPAVALGYLVMGLVWPWSVLEPLNPLRAAGYFSHFFEKPWKEMFDGMPLPVPDMPRSYVPTLFLLTEPEILLLLGAGGIAGAVVSAVRRQLSLAQRASLLLVALAATLPVAIAVITRPPMYNGIRHFVFVMPPFAALAGFAGDWLARKIAARGRLAIAAATAGLALALLAPVREMIRLHPYQYTQFNSLAGGIRAADEHYMLDYWGLAFKQAALELRTKLEQQPWKRSKRGPWKVAVCGPNFPAAVELGPQFVTSWQTTGADFALVLGEFYCANLHAPVLVQIEREGVVYARVYDIRERTVSSLFTIPPP